MFLGIYAIIVTIIAIGFIINSFKWKRATRTITLFCIEKFREPTDEEVADYTRRAAGNTMKFK